MDSLKLKQSRRQRKLSHNQNFDGDNNNKINNRIYQLVYTMNDYRDIITIEPAKRSGQPCIRGMRITVYDVFEYLASGMTVAEVLHDFPELTETDIRACFAYAVDKGKSQVEISYVSQSN